jgi:hypothetical protein
MCCSKLRARLQLTRPRRIIRRIDIKLLHCQVERADGDVLFGDPDGDEIAAHPQNLGGRVVAGFYGREHRARVAAARGEGVDLRDEAGVCAGVEGVERAGFFRGAER